MKYKIKNHGYLIKAIILSCLLHLFFGAIFILHLDFFPAINNKSHNQILPSYLYHFTAAKDNSMKKSNKSFFNKLVGKKTTKSVKDTEKNNLKNTAQISGNLTKSYRDELLKKLHDLIQNQIVYPKELLNDDNKYLTVNFELHENGYIKNIKIIRSSGVAILDQAVSTAIEELQPISFASQFLNQPDNFSVIVEFQK